LTEVEDTLKNLEREKKDIGKIKIFHLANFYNFLGVRL